jgi:hypothetical protein
MFWYIMIHWVNTPLYAKGGRIYKEDLSQL